VIPAREGAARRADVRDAARAWRAAGAVDDATLTRIAAAYPDDRPRMAAAWKVLVFAVVTIAANALFLAVVELIHAEPGAGLCFVFAVPLVWATELLLHGTRTGENGSAAATSFWAIGYAVAGAALFIATGGRGGDEAAISVALLAAAVLFAAACSRWGYAAYGVFASMSFFFLLARTSFGRPAWLLAGLALLAAAPRLQDRGSLAPPFRRAAGGLFVVAAAAVYAAVNRYSLDRRFVESMRAGGASTGQPGPALAALSGLATAVFPVLLVVWGLRSRRPLVLDVGLVSAALSLVTLRYYVHLAPLWLLLTAAGSALVLAALGLHRWLRQAPGEERGGVTARLLFGARRRGLETAAVVAAFAPESGLAAPREPGGFTPGGGRYGGGGAEGSF
jgi:hypothetical protein